MLQSTRSVCPRPRERWSSVALLVLTLGAYGEHRVYGRARCLGPCRITSRSRAASARSSLATPLRRVWSGFLAFARSAYTRLRLRVCGAPLCVAYLNGHDIDRVELGARPVGYHAPERFSAVSTGTT